MQLLPQTTFNWKGFIQELQHRGANNTLLSTVGYSDKDKYNHQSLNFDLFIEALLGFMNKNHCFPMLIKLRPSSTTHHLQDISDWKINISLRFSIIVFCTLQKKQSIMMIMSSGIPIFSPVYQSPLIKRDGFVEFSTFNYGKRDRGLKILFLPDDPILIS